MRTRSKKSIVESECQKKRESSHSNKKQITCVFDKQRNTIVCVDNEKLKSSIYWRDRMQIVMAKYKES